MSKARYTIIRDAFRVRRYHTVYTVQHEETIGHHTANVVAMLFHLFDDHPPLYLIRYALHHDVAEIVTGDVPAPAKWAYPDLLAELEKVEKEHSAQWGLETEKGMDPLHRDLVRYADIMDLCFKAVDELASGNTGFFVVLSRGTQVVQSLLEGPLKTHGPAWELFEMLRSNPFVEVTFSEENDHARTVKH